MKEIIIHEYILDNAIEAIRIAANILNSRGRETAADRQIEFTERLLKWVKEGKNGKPPSYIQ